MMDFDLSSTVSNVAAGKDARVVHVNTVAINHYHTEKTHMTLTEPMVSPTNRGRPTVGFGKSRTSVQTLKFPPGSTDDLLESKRTPQITSEHRPPGRRKAPPRRRIGEQTDTLQ